MLIALSAIILIASNACAQSSSQSISTTTNAPSSSAASTAGWPVTEGRSGGGRYSPFNRVIALDPETGKEMWTFDPRIDKDRRFANMLINRGVAYWREANAESAGAGRVFIGTLDARLIALEVKTGKPCRDFGKNGTVNLLE
jgi:glucose dehydrogenase